MAGPLDVHWGASDAERYGSAGQTLAPRFRERLRVFAMRRLGDLAAADDVAQETLARVAAALREGRVDNLDALPGFVFQTAKYVCMHYARSAGREARALSSLAVDPSEAKETSDPLMDLIGDERRALVRRAIAKLEAPDADLLRMLYFERLGPADAAARLGVTAEALRVRKHRAIRRLAGFLEPDLP